MLRRLLFLGALVSVVMPTMASADETPTAVLGLETSDCPQAVADEVAESLRRSVAANHDLKLVNGKDLVEVKLVFSCPDEAPSCMSQAGDSLGAKRLIYGSLKRSGSDVAVWLKALDVPAGKITGWVTDTLPRHPTGGEAMQQASARWLAKLLGKPVAGVIKVAGGPAGAAVVVDGKDVGVLGVEPFFVKDLAPGEHEVALEGPGNHASSQRVLVNGGQTATLSFTQQAGGTAGPSPVADAPKTKPPEDEAAERAPSPQPDEPTSRVSAYRMGFWITLGGALLSTGAAVKYGLDVVKVNKDLDPYRRFMCTSASGWCDSQGRAAAPISDQTTLDYIANRNADGRHAQKAQWISIGVASLFGAASGVLFYLGYLDSAEREPVGQKHGLRLFPTVGVASGGVNAEFDF